MKNYILYASKHLPSCTKDEYVRDMLEEFPTPECEAVFYTNGSANVNCQFPFKSKNDNDAIKKVEDKYDLEFMELYKVHKGKEKLVKEW